MQPTEHYPAPEDNASLPGLVLVALSGKIDRLALVRRKGNGKCEQIFLLLMSNKAIMDIGGPLRAVFAANENPPGWQTVPQFHYNERAEIAPLFDWMDEHEMRFTWAEVEWPKKTDRANPLAVCIRGAQACEAVADVLNKNHCVCNLK